MKDGVSVIVPDLSFSLDAGERLAIVGESGCGKTMTAMAILSLLPSNCTREGQIIFDGRELRPRDERRMRALRGRDIVFVPQSGGEFLNPALTVGTQLAESLRRAGVKGRAALAEMYALDCYWASFVWLEADADFVREGLTPAE